jgi:hypothetical protein
VKIKRAETPSWEYEVQEVSAGVYRVRATDAAGRAVEFTGEDPDLLIEACVREAVAISGRTLDQLHKDASRD